MSLAKWQALLPHLSGIDHVIWDWNGTLLDDLAHSVDVLNQMLTARGLPVIDEVFHRQSFRFPVLEYYRALGLDAEPGAFAAACNDYDRLFHDAASPARPWPGARDFLSLLKAERRTQSLLSLTEHRRLVHAATSFGILELFDHCVGHHDRAACSKLDAGRDLVERSGVAPDRTVLIGDTDHDLAVGEALGLKVILLEHGHQAGTRLRARHPLVLGIF